MDTITHANRQILRQNVKSYMDSILAQLPHVIDVGWENIVSNSARAFGNILKDFCGSPQTVPLTGFVTFDISDIFELNVTNEVVDQVADECKEALDDASAYGGNGFKARVHRILANGKQNKRRFYVLYVSFYTSHNMFHATSLIFDTHLRRQIFFDPDATQSSKTVRLFDRIGAIHPAYTAFPSPRALNDGPSFQGVFENVLPQDSGADDDPHVNRGVCAVLNFLVGLLVLRFQLFNPKEITDALLALPNNQRLSFIQRSKALFMNVCLDGISYQQITESIRDKTSNAPCGVFCHTSKRFCRRNRCHGSNFCWQHRWIVSNRDSASKKCVAQDVRPCIDLF